MGCKCRAPVIDYPDSVDWGPILWKMLHALADRLSSGTPTLFRDEINLWKKLIPFTGDIIPCDICRAHYKEYLGENPMGFLKMARPDAATWIQTWLWTLHNDINVENNKPTFAFTDLHATYGSINLTDMFHQLEPVMKRAIEPNGVSFLKWKAWIIVYKTLVAMY
jgi:hypothetical protein